MVFLLNPVIRSMTVVMFSQHFQAVALTLPDICRISKLSLVIVKFAFLLVLHFPCSWLCVRERKHIQLQKIVFKGYRAVLDHNLNVWSQRALSHCQTGSMRARRTDPASANPAPIEIHSSLDHCHLTTLNGNSALHFLEHCIMVVLTPFCGPLCVLTQQWGLTQRPAWAPVVHVWALGGGGGWGVGGLEGRGKLGQYVHCSSSSSPQTHKPQFIPIHEVQETVCNRHILPYQTPSSSCANLRLLSQYQQHSQVITFWLTQSL